MTETQQTSAPRTDSVGAPENGATDAPTITVLQIYPQANLGMFDEWLTAEGFDVQIHDIVQNEFPTEIGDGLIVLGGPQNAYFDEPWANRVRSLLIEVVKKDIPTLGICLGHQLLAVATGGKVGLGGSYTGEFGITEINWTDAAKSDPVLGAVANAPTGLLEHHNDWVEKLPPGAQILARSERFDVQAFRIGSALGVQFHPEASPEAVASWHHPERERLGREFAEVRGEVFPVAQRIAQAFGEQVSKARSKALVASAI